MDRVLMVCLVLLSLLCGGEAATNCVMLVDWFVIQPLAYFVGRAWRAVGFAARQQRLVQLFGCSRAGTG